MVGAAIVIGVLLGLIGLNKEPSEGELLRAAETAFDRGMRAQGQEATAAFALAAVQYEKLRQRGVSNVALYRNQGNAYLLAGDLPRALLAYRRGLRLAPNDGTLQAQLGYAREQVVHAAPGAFGRPPVDNWPPWLPHPAPVPCITALLILYALAWVAGTRWFMTRRSELLALAGLALVLSSLPAGLLVWDEWTRREEQRYPLVIVAENVSLAKGNGRLYPTYPFPLSRGVEARLRFARGDWLQIELASGEIGWLPRGSIVVDE